MHLNGLEAMGVDFELVHGELVGRVDGRLKGTEVELPFPSVGATENLLFAGALAEGDTVIVNAAREPEIEDLITQLTEMGARITGGGTPLVTIHEVDRCRRPSTTSSPIDWRQGTYAAAAAITGGDITVTGCMPEHLRMELRKLEEAGCEVEQGNGWLRVKGRNGRPGGLRHPSIPRLSHRHAPPDGGPALGRNRHLGHHRESLRLPVSICRRAGTDGRRYHHRGPARHHPGCRAALRLPGARRTSAPGPRSCWPVCEPRARPWWARRATSTGAMRSSRRGSDRWERE